MSADGHLLDGRSTVLVYCASHSFGRVAAFTVLLVRASVARHV